MLQLVRSTIFKLTNIVHLKQFHAQLIHNSLHRQNYWLSALIALCTCLRAPPCYTRLLFSSTPHPNIHVYASILKYYAQLGAHYQVLSLFKHMRGCNSNQKPNASVYSVVIKSGGKAGILLHSHVVKLGHDDDPYVRNVVLELYAKYGSTRLARKVFDEMTQRSLVDWNSMISGYWKCGNETEACRLFHMMPEKNVITWTAMVTGYAKLKDLVRARMYFDEMPVKSVVSWNAMLSGYVQNGFPEEALSLFNDMITTGVEPNETTWVTVISSCSLHGDPCIADSLLKLIDEKGVRMNLFVKTALLDLYAKCGSIETARKIFDEFGENKNSVAWNSMISAYARLGHLESAREVFDKMPRRDVVSWNSMIAGHAQNGQSGLAIELFKEMIGDKETKPDEVTMVSVFSACGHLGALELGKWAINFISENEINLTITGFNSLIFMYSKCGSMKDAQMIFQKMNDRDVFSYNTLIAGFAAHGQGSEAIKLWSTMKEEGIEPDRVTYICILTACSHGGLLQEGQKVFGSIENPSVDHFACMVDLLARVGKLDEAKRLIDSMPMEPHAGVYGSLLNACRIHKRIELGEFAASKLIELEPQNSGNYVLLSNIYASAGRWADADKAREIMRKEGVEKTAGWSCVEYKGNLHRFTVGDRSHEQTIDIYELLDKLGKKMRRLGYMADNSCVLRDIDEEDKEEMVGTHSEKLAVCFALLVSEPGAVIRVIKNLRICLDCHTAMKMISKLEGREIILRDNSRFHHFMEGLCSCKDYW